MRTTPSNRNRGAAPNNRETDAERAEITFTLTASDHARIKAEAERERISLSAYARRAAVLAAELAERERAKR